MKFIITTHKNCFLYNLNNRKIINIERGTDGKRWAYGVSWYKDRLFIAWRHPAEILEYDINLKFTGRKCNSTLIGDPHQIQCFDEKIWVTSTGNNSILIFDVYTLDLLECWKFHIDLDLNDDTPYIPKEGKNKRPDYKHYNSIMFYKKFLYINAHMTVRNPPSKIWVFEYPSRKFVKKICGGVSTHNIFFINDKITVCDSINSRLLHPQTEQVLFTMDKKAFLRGVSMPDDLIIVGRSDICNDRKKRNKGHGGILIFKNDFNKFKTHWLGEGPVEEIRCLDSLDQAHPTNVFWK